MKNIVLLLVLVSLLAFADVGSVGSALRWIGRQLHAHEKVLLLIHAVLGFTALAVLLYLSEKK